MVLAGTTRPMRGKGAELTHDRQRMRGVRGSEMGGRKSLRRISMNRGCEITSVPPTVFVDLFDIWSHATPFAWFLVRRVLLPKLEVYNFSRDAEIIYQESKYCIVRCITVKLFYNNY